MALTFQILDKASIHDVIPLVKLLNDNKISENILKQRFSEMIRYSNYECAVIMDEERVVGVTGLWFCTRHYSGRSVEPDHVFIDEAYRNRGLGKQFFEWIYDYAKKKGCEAMELNTYVSNAPSHKFYFNEGFKILGFHFLKTL